MENYRLRFSLHTQPCWEVLKYKGEAHAKGNFPFLPTTSPPPHHLGLKETLTILNEWPWDCPVSSTVRARSGIVMRTLSWVSSPGT